ncbi:MAG: fatty acid desaturase [Planctomycetota bacterium]|nr:fatty acid desaturase [Planctomycetota bacterium]MDA0934325.1 fatty acid desaturase [Planctomycetota bacterium]MDA1221128.1 fatty acid desaturase [Planctomycetota bacterium]
MNRLRPDWTNLVFIAVAHLLAVVAILYMALVHFSWWTVGFGLVWGVLCSLSITGGYHRLFSHGAYAAVAPIRAFYLAFGAASVQNSALAWSADHRTHHAHTDTDEDPYNIRRGFWWAHIGWVLFRAPKAKNFDLVKDLQRDPLVMFQHRYYLPIALTFGAALPFAVGSLWGDAIGAGLVAGFLRLVLQWHATFSINSLTHMVGAQPFGDRTSARDSFWIALVTFGEGYHNFHHRFQNDYRNGIRWYHFDPTKWWVWTLARFRLTRNLRRVPAERIEAVRREAKKKAAA